MSDLLTHIGRLEMVDVDLDKEPQCEGAQHPFGGKGHNALAPAEWVLYKPCCGGQVLLCANRVRYMQSRLALTCAACAVRNPIGAYRFIEL